MEELFSGVVAELLALVGYAALTVVLAVLGLLSELTGVEMYATGDVGMAAWFGFMGALLVVAAVLLVRDRLAPTLRLVGEAMQ